jgi:hypothetical protein
VRAILDIEHIGKTDAMFEFRNAIERRIQLRLVSIERIQCEIYAEGADRINGAFITPSELVRNLQRRFQWTRIIDIVFSIPVSFRWYGPI